MNPLHDVGKLPDETDNPTTSDSPSVSPKLDMPESDKNIKGEFKTKTISIRRAKDPRTFKCSQCDKRTTTLRELNAHYIANHRKLKCDICDKSFNMPGALRKHCYTHVEENSQYRCRTCNKIFPFESQLKSTAMSIVITVITFVLLPIVGNLLNILKTWQHMPNHMRSSINVHTATTRTVTSGTLITLTYPHEECPLHVQTV